MHLCYLLAVEFDLAGNNNNNDDDSNSCNPDDLLELCGTSSSRAAST